MKSKAWKTSLTNPSLSLLNIKALGKPFTFKSVRNFDNHLHPDFNPFDRGNPNPGKGKDKKDRVEKDDDDHPSNGNKKAVILSDLSAEALA